MERRQEIKTLIKNDSYIESIEWKVIPSLLFQEKTCSKAHSKELDKIFGYKIPRIEQKLEQKYRNFYKSSDKTNKKGHFAGSEAWIGLHPQVLQTPYSKIYQIFSLLSNFNPKSIVDLGAGYGRVGLVSSMLFPEASFIGLEVIRERCEEANRIYKKFKLKNCEIQHGCLVKKKTLLPQADIYFIYDFGFLDDIYYVLNNVLSIKRNTQFFVVAIGSRINSIIGKGNFIDTRCEIIASKEGFSIFSVRTNYK
ncbi:MAG: hypothetical protein AB8G05_02570 [Oligoflexales bacterium]